MANDMHDELSKDVDAELAAIMSEIEGIERSASSAAPVAAQAVEAVQNQTIPAVEVKAEAEAEVVSPTKLAEINNDLAKDFEGLLADLAKVEQPVAPAVDPMEEFAKEMAAQLSAPSAPETPQAVAPVAEATTVPEPVQEMAVAPTPIKLEAVAPKSTPAQGPERMEFSFAQRFDCDFTFDFPQDQVSVKACSETGITIELKSGTKIHFPFPQAASKVLAS